jgi:hypothetical protein
MQLQHKNSILILALFLFFLYFRLSSNYTSVPPISCKLASLDRSARCISIILTLSKNDVTYVTKTKNRFLPHIMNY